MDAEVLEAIKENTAALNQLIQIIQQKETRAEWVTPEEAATILGFNITKSKEHRKRINSLVNRGLLTKFIGGRPYKYHRKEIEQLAKKIASGDLDYTGRA